MAKGTLRTDAKRIFIWRYMFMRDSLRELLRSHPVDCVGVESPPFGELWSEGLYGLFLFVTEALFEARKDVVYFDPHRVKLLAKMDPKIRRGTMDKSDMVAAARADTEVKRWNHNEADAYIIARSAARFWEYYSGDLPVDELTPAETSIFCGAHTYQRGQKAGRTVNRGIIFKEDDRFFRFSQLSTDQTQTNIEQRK